jgi:hypothetical protein
LDWQKLVFVPTPAARYHGVMFWRVLTALALVLPLAAALLGVFLLLPVAVALGCAIAGMVLFKVGAKLDWQWPTVIGGAVMFSGVLAWALNVTGR